MRPFFPALSVLLLAAGPAWAQGPRTIVVPADAAVAVPPRGQPMPQLAAPAATYSVALPLLAAPVLPLAASPLALGALPGLLVPLAATALLGGSLAGGGGGASAPATTR